MCHHTTDQQVKWHEIDRNLGHDRLAETEDRIVRQYKESQNRIPYQAEPAPLCRRVKSHSSGLRPKAKARNVADPQTCSSEDIHVPTCDPEVDEDDSDHAAVEEIKQSNAQPRGMFMARKKSVVVHAATLQDEQDLSLIHI